MQGLPSRLTQEQMQAAMQELQERLGGGDMEDDDDNDLPPNTMNNKAEGEAFLAENAQKPGITTLPSGLQYEVIDRRQRQKAHPALVGDDSLPRHPDKRHRVRQQLPARPARYLPGERRNCRLD